MELAILFVGVALTALRVVLPMVGWTISPLVARAIASVALVLIVGSLGYIMWQLRGPLSTPIEFLYSFVELAEVRLFFIYASFLLLVLILVMRFVIIPLDRRMREMHQALVRYVYPRHLSEHQIDSIGNYLAQHPAHQIKLQQPPRNEEASAYRADFQRALIRGGWKTAAIDIRDDLPEGISITVQRPPRTPSDSQDQDKADPEYLLREALKQARVSIHYGSSGGGEQVASIVLTLGIGRRKMDDNDLRARQDRLERFRKMQESDEDDY